MSDLLSIGASGVRAYQTALGVISDNISNAGTAGYTRRTTALTEVASANGGVTSVRNTQGNGVALAGINRMADAYKTAAVRVAGSDLARTEAGATWLDRVQSALTGANLGDRLTGFFSAATTLAADPTSAAARASMLEAGTSVAGAFGASGRALDQVTADLDGTANAAASQLNTLGAALAKINDGLGRVASGGSASAGLQDQRDQLLEQMSAISDVDVQTDALGRATVRLGGTTGPVFVSGNDSGNVTYARTGGAVSFAVHRDAQTTAISPSGGALAGVADAAGRVTDARAALNDLATNFSTGVNAVQAQGRDLNGSPGAAMFAAGASATDLSMTLTDPSGIAAAAVGGGQRDASNLTNLASLRTSGAFESRTTALVVDNAAALAAKNTVADAQSSIRDGAVSARDAVSGVSLDTEAVDLLRFQQAYQASSRVIQVARETFQSILEIR